MYIKIIFYLKTILIDLGIIANIMTRKTGILGSFENRTPSGISKKKRSKILVIKKFQYNRYVCYRGFTVH